MIYISCFVKTSHVEEYLNVQEAVMLDLLRIVGHHKARLATQFERFRNHMAMQTLITFLLERTCIVAPVAVHF